MLVKLTVKDESCIDPQLLAISYRNDHADDTDSDDDDELAPFSNSLPPSSPHKYYEEVSDDNPQEPSRYGTPPPSQGPYHIVHEPQAATDAHVTVQRLLGVLGELNRRKRHIDDDVDVEHERTAGEEAALLRERVIIPVRRSKKGVRKNKGGSLHGGYEGGSAIQETSQDVSQSRLDEQFQQLAVTSQPHLNELPNHAAPQAAISPEESAAFIAQLLSRQALTPIPMHIKKRVRKE